MKIPSFASVLIFAALLAGRAEERPVVPITPGSLRSCAPATNVPAVPLRPVAAPIAEALAQAFDQACARAPRPPQGLSVAVLIPEAGIWSAQRGLDGHGAPVTAATRFHAGSAGKLITSALVSRAVTAGRIDPAAPLSRYVEVPKSWRQIPMVTLLNHSSGIPSFEMNRAYDRTQPASPQALLGLAGKPLFPAGTAHGYSNTGYVVLGLLLEKTEGRPWNQLVTERVFAGLPGLEARTVVEITTNDLASGHVNHAPIPFLADYRNVYSCGGVVCSALDLARLYDGVLNGRLLAADEVHFLLSDMVPMGKSQAGIEVHAGRGIIRVVTPKGVVLMHGGSIPGFVCTAGTGLASGITVAVMANDAETVTDPYFFALLEAADKLTGAPVLGAAQPIPGQTNE